MRVWLKIQGSRFRFRPHTFVKIDHEIISTVTLLPSTESFKKGCCQLQVKVPARSTGWLLVQACSGKSVFRWTDHPAMTIAVDLGCKATKQTKQMTELAYWVKTGKTLTVLAQAWKLLDNRRISWKLLENWVSLDKYWKITLRPWNHSKALKRPWIYKHAKLPRIQ